MTEDIRETIKKKMLKGVENALLYTDVEEKAIVNFKTFIEALAIEASTPKLEAVDKYRLKDALK